MEHTTIKIGNITLAIKSNSPLSKDTIKEIENIDVPIYWSDSQSKHYSMDTKLNNGLWLENIFYNNELNHATSLILN